MQRHWKRIQVGDERVSQWFAWLPVTVRDSSGVETRWMEDVVVRQVFTEFRSGNDWRNAQFVNPQENTRDQQPRTKEAAIMSDENERSVASDGSVGERPLGDPEVALEMLKLRVAELEQAIHRLADQDATLSVQGGNVIVEMDATLTDAEREAVERACRVIASTLPYESQQGAEDYRTLRGLLERLGGGA